MATRRRTTGLTSEDRNRQFLRAGRLTRADEREVANEFRQRYFDGVIRAHFRSPTRRKQGGVSLQNVVGFGIGEKTTDGKFTGDTALVVYVVKKLPKSRLTSSRAPAKVAGIPTDVVEVGTFRAINGMSACKTNPATRQPRPFVAGVSIGGGTTPAGSIGYRVERVGIDEQMILSNYHVLGDLDNQSSLPDVFQPGFGDGADPQTDRVGRLLGRVPIRFGQESANKMDAAVASVIDGVCAPTLCRVGKLTAAENPKREDVIRIFGKSTRHSIGFVRERMEECLINYGNKTARFVDQLLLQIDPQSPNPLAADGDSGSLVIKQGTIACALLFAADDTGQFALATPIERVHTKFKVKLVT